MAPISVKDIPIRRAHHVYMQSSVFYVQEQYVPDRYVGKTCFFRASAFGLFVRMRYRR